MFGTKNPSIKPYANPSLWMGHSLYCIPCFFGNAETMTFCWQMDIFPTENGPRKIAKKVRFMYTNQKKLLSQWVFLVMSSVFHVSMGTRPSSKPLIDHRHASHGVGVEQKLQTQTIKQQQKFWWVWYFRKIYQKDNPKDVNKFGRPTE